MPLCGGARNEAAGEVVADRARADEEAAAKRQRERRRRPRLERADALPRALDAAPDGAVEDAAARDLEVGEAGPVEQLGEAEQLGGRHEPGERLLAEDADRRVDEAWHGRGPYRRRADRLRDERSRPGCPWPERLDAVENKPGHLLPKEARPSRTHLLPPRCTTPSPT